MALTETPNNKRIARRYAELINQHDAALYNEVCSPRFRDHNPAPGFQDDLEGMKSFMSQVFAGFPDVRVEVDRLLVSDEFVTILWTAHATHEGPFMGVAATGKRTTMNGIEVIRIRKGLVSDSWHSEDLLGLMQQIGAVPEQTAVPVAA
ncbi:MAG: ester cyclase [Thermoplasmatota archaeon]